MGIAKQIKTTWTLRQVMGFFFFFIGLLTLAVALDYGYANVFESSEAVLGLYSAFIYLVWAVGVGAVVYVFLNALAALGGLAENYRKKR